MKTDTSGWPVDPSALKPDELIEYLIPEINRLLKGGFIPLAPGKRRHYCLDVHYSRLRSAVRVVVWNQETLSYRYTDVPCDQGAALTMARYRWRTAKNLNDALRAGRTACV